MKNILSKIGIMGGTFNPIHNAHIEIAKSACEQFNLDKVLFITSGNPPHKKNRTKTSPYLRHKMVTEAIKNYEKFEACDYEVKKETYSYTLETLKYIKKEYNNPEIFFIIGADSLHDLPKWYKPRTILELCTLLVYKRIGYDMEKDLKEIKKEYYCIADFIDAENVDISSTDIREKIKNGEEIDQFVPKSVNEFIKRNNLYKENTENLKERIKKALTKERFTHSMGVVKMAEGLAKIYKEDEKKAYTAAILHDCAKNIDLETSLKKCEDYDVYLDESERKNPLLIHAKLGEKIAEYEYGIKDRDILNAIKWHTVGRKGMSTLEKIIFVADMIEKGRTFPGVENLRKLAREDLDSAVKECILNTIKFNEEKNKEIHPNAYEVINWIESFKK